MPRLIPQSKREEKLVRATRTVPDTNTHSLDLSGRPHIYRGEIVSASDPRVKAHPDAWEPMPPLEERSPTPGRGEPAAVSTTTFAIDGRIVARGDRLWADDPIVRAVPRVFYIQRP